MLARAGGLRDRCQSIGSDRQRGPEAGSDRHRTAFARTMAMRDHVAFTGFLAEEAVFFSGRVLRGKQAVAEA